MRKVKSLESYLILILFAVIMSFICVGSSPLLDYMDPDSQNFRLLGRAMARGQIAYVDIFDHKGPYIYFIEYLGALISPHSEWGLFIIELVCYSVNICFAYKLVKLFASQKTALISACCFLGFSFNFFTFVTGNLTDSYSVTFQIIGLYLVADYFMSNKIEHPPVYMAIHAILACCCGLMRPVNAGGWISFGIVLAIRLFAYKRIKNFFANLLGLVIGTIIGFAPALLYAVKFNCLEDMWYGTIIANMSYTKNAATTRGFLSFIKGFVFDPSFAVVILAVASIFVVIKVVKKNWAAVMFAAMFVGQLLFMNVSLRNDGQYNQLYMIYTIPAIAFIVDWAIKRIKVPLIMIALIALTLLGNLQLIKQITKYGVYHYHYEAACDIKEIISDDTDCKILVTGTHSLYYNTTDTVSHIKYFIIYGQGLDYSVFPDAVNMQAESVLSGENDYVVLTHYVDGNVFNVENIDKQIEPYLNENYEMLYKSDKIGTMLYKKR